MMAMATSTTVPDDSRILTSGLLIQARQITSHLTETYSKRSTNSTNQQLSKLQKEQQLELAQGQLQSQFSVKMTSKQNFSSTMLYMLPT